jgi:hypothetical protein
MAGKNPYPRWRKKRVDKKVVPFVKLVGPMESPSRDDKENGLTFSDQCTWWTERRREWVSGGGGFKREEGRLRRRRSFFFWFFNPTVVFF